MPLAAILAPGRLDCAPDAALGHYTHEKSPGRLRRGAGDARGDRGGEADRSGARTRTHGLERLRAIGEPAIRVIRDVRGLGCYFGVEIGGDDRGRNSPTG